MKRKKKRWKRKKIKGKNNNIDAYGPRTPDTEKFDELDNQKKKRQKKGWPIPAHSRAKHLKKKLKKKRRRRRKELCGTKRTLEKCVRSTVHWFPSTLPDSTLIILFVGNLWIFFWAGWMKIENNLENFILRPGIFKIN